jgi:hypothetical protein
MGYVTQLRLFHKHPYAATINDGNIQSMKLIPKACASYATMKSVVQYVHCSHNGMGLLRSTIKNQFSVQDWQLGMMFCHHGSSFVFFQVVFHCGHRTVRDDPPDTMGALCVEKGYRVGAQQIGGRLGHDARSSKHAARYSVVGAFFKKVHDVVDEAIQSNGGGHTKLHPRLRSSRLLSYLA